MMVVNHHPLWRPPFLGMIYHHHPPKALLMKALLGGRPHRFPWLVRVGLAVVWNSYWFWRFPIHHLQTVFSWAGKPQKMLTFTCTSLPPTKTIVDALVPWSRQQKTSMPEIGFFWRPHASGQNKMTWRNQQQSFEVLHPRKLTWLDGKSTIWRCISYQKWWFSNVILVFRV